MPSVSESFVRSGRERREWKGMVTITPYLMLNWYEAILRPRARHRNPAAAGLEPTRIAAKDGIP